MIKLGIGEPVTVKVDGPTASASLKGTVTGIKESRSGAARTQTIEILDYGTDELEYYQILYDRVPTLPQSLQRDFGVMVHLWQNIAHRVARTRK